MKPIHVLRTVESSLDSQGFPATILLALDATKDIIHCTIFREQQNTQICIPPSSWRRKDGKLILNSVKIAESCLPYSKDALEQAQKRAKCLQHEEGRPVSPITNFSPSRFLKKIIRSPSRKRISSVAQKLLEATSVFVPEEESSLQVNKNANPAA